MIKKHEAYSSQHIFLLFPSFSQTDSNFKISNLYLITNHTQCLNHLQGYDYLLKVQYPYWWAWKAPFGLKEIQWMLMDSCFNSINWKLHYCYQKTQCEALHWSIHFEKLICADFNSYFDQDVKE